jgi:hypothetical protein
MSAPPAKKPLSLTGFVAGLLGIAAYLGAGIWLMEAVAWPDMCRPSGRNLAYMISALSCSPGLLDKGWAGIALFVWFWSIPAAILWMVASRLLKRPAAYPISQTNSPE